VPEIKARAADDPVLDELCGAPAALETKSRTDGIRAVDLRALGEAAIRTADEATSDRTVLGGSSIRAIAGGVAAGLQAASTAGAPDNKALRHPSDIAGARARRKRAYDVYQRTKNRLSNRDPLTAATITIGKEVMDLKRRIAAAEVKRDRPPGMAARFPGYHGAASRATGAKALHRAATIHWMRTGEKQFQGYHIDDLQRRAFGRKEMFGGSNPSGGYFLLTERGNPLDAAITELSPLRQYATVRQITAGEYEQPLNKKGTKAYCKHPAKAAGCDADQAACGCIGRRAVCQFHGNSSSIRLAG
jgi:hypothetical protein